MSCPQRRAWTALCAASCLLLAACNLGLPQAQNDPTKNFVLSVPSAAAQKADVSANAPVLRLRSVELPGYLRGRAMVVRNGDNEVDFREFARWGEPLEQGIGRVLREELQARGAVSSVLVSGSRAGDAADAAFELTIRVLSCEGVVDGSVAFHAAWELMRSGDNPGAALRGDYRPGDLRWTPKNEATLAAALSRGVAGLADDIAAALARK